MKNLMIILLACLTTSLKAQTLDDHITLTQDAVQRLVGDIYGNDQGSMLNIPDYREWEQDYTQGLEERMVRFETKLQRQVYMPLKEIVARYEKVYKDNSLPQMQKKQLMDSYIQQIKSMTPYIQESFQKLVLELYFSHNLFPKSLVNEKGRRLFRPTYKLIPIFEDSSQGETYKLSKDQLLKTVSSTAKWFDYNNSHTFAYSYQIKEGDISSWNFLNPDQLNVLVPYFESDHPHLNPEATPKSRYITLFQSAYELLFNELPFEASHQRIIRGCGTRACVVLKSSTLAFEISSIKRMIDRDIVITLPYVPVYKSAEIKIEAPNLYVKQYMNVLNRTDYSDEVEAMPFEF